MNQLPLGLEWQTLIIYSVKGQSELFCRLKILNKKES